MGVKSLIADVAVEENNSQEFSYPKSLRLRTRRDYQLMANHVKKFTGKWILADMKMTKKPCSRLGITVTKRFGHAVQRNRFKRIVREAFRLTIRKFNFSCDLVIRPRTYALKAYKDDIQKELISFLENNNVS